jgi:hypothetical protein
MSLLPCSPEHVTSWRPRPAGTIGVGYVQVITPLMSALAESKVGGPSPRTPGSTLIARSQLSRGCVLIAKEPYFDDVTAIGVAVGVGEALGATFGATVASGNVRGAAAGAHAAMRNARAVAAVARLMTVRL